MEEGIAIKNYGFMNGRIESILIYNQEDLDFLISRDCILGESGIYMLCKFISVRLDDNKMVGEFKPSQSPSFFRGKKSFRKKEKAIMENIFISSKVATETSSVNLQAFPENNFFLAFRGIYSTTRLFFFEEFIKLFKAEDVEWRDKMSSKFYF